MSNKIHHIGDIDTKFNTIIECANRILQFQKDSITAKTDEEYEQILFFIEEQKMMISEYTNTSPEDIVPYVAGLNALKKMIEDEQDPEKKEEKKSFLKTLSDNLKSEVCKTASKESRFRSSQKYDIVSSATLEEKNHMPEELDYEQR